MLDTNCDAMSYKNLWERKEKRLLLIWREGKVLKINLVQLSNLNDDIFRIVLKIFIGFDAENCEERRVEKNI